MIASAIAIAGALACSHSAGAAAGAPVRPPFPHGVVGIAANGNFTPGDLPAIASAGAGVIRANLNWNRMQPHQGGPIDWSESDALMTRAAKNGLNVEWTVATTPRWARSSPRANLWDPPLSSEVARDGWQQFLARAAARYGQGGRFWTSQPGLARPRVYWQVWNEPSCAKRWDGPPSAREYADLLHLSSPVIRANDPAARIITGGLFTQCTPTSYLNHFYRFANRSDFDMVGSHPYEDSPYQVYSQIQHLRGVIDRAGDQRTGIWIDEIAWFAPGANGRKAQAQNLRILFQMLATHRAELGVRGLLWFGYRDNPDAAGCVFCRHSGLIQYDGSPKPSLHLFTGFTQPAATVMGKVTDRHGGPLAHDKIYLDLNGNGELDRGEPTTRTNPDGLYSFHHLLGAETYKVHLIPRAGQHCIPIESCTRPVRAPEPATVGEAAFSLSVPQTLTVAKTGDGSGSIRGPGLNCASMCRHVYQRGALISLKAVPEPGSVFAGWQGQACTTARRPSCRLHPHSKRGVVAVFNPSPGG